MNEINEKFKKIADDVNEIYLNKSAKKLKDLLVTIPGYINNLMDVFVKKSLIKWVAVFDFSLFRSIMNEEPSAPGRHKQPSVFPSMTNRLYLILCAIRTNFIGYQRKRIALDYPHQGRFY